LIHTRTNITAFTSRPGSCSSRFAFSPSSPSPADGSAFPPRWAATAESNASSVPSSQTARPAKAVALTTGHGLELALAAVSVLVALGGFYIAYVFYCEKPGTAAALAERNRRAYDLVKNKYWVDEFYNASLITPLLMFTRGVLELIFERGVVDGSGKAAGATTRGMAWLTRKQISGNIRSYAGWLAIGAAAVIAVMVFGNSLWGHL